MSAYFAVINPAAGGGRCGKLVEATLERLREAGLDIETALTHRSGEGLQLARGAYDRGHRRFIAVGGDGTAHEVLNGLFSRPPPEPPVLGFVPLGTGNSFLRDFAVNGLDHATASLIAGRRTPCDVVRLTHQQGVLHYLNLLSIGFSAEVAVLTNRRFKALGEFGYMLGVLACTWRRRLHRFPLRCDEATDLEQEPCLFLTFSNSKYTGGKMLIAPQADVRDGRLEFVRVGPLGRLALLRSLRRLYDGSHVDLPMVSRQAVQRVDFEFEGPADVMVDGEVLRLHCRRLDVLPQALQVVA